MNASLLTLSKAEYYSRFANPTFRGDVYMRRNGEEYDLRQGHGDTLGSAPRIPRGVFTEPEDEIVAKAKRRAGLV